MFQLTEVSLLWMPHYAFSTAVDELWGKTEGPLYSPLPHSALP